MVCIWAFEHLSILLIKLKQLPGSLLIKLKASQSSLTTACQQEGAAASMAVHMATPLPFSLFDDERGKGGFYRKYREAIQMEWGKMKWPYLQGSETRTSRKNNETRVGYQMMMWCETMWWCWRRCYSQKCFGGKHYIGLHRAPDLLSDVIVINININSQTLRLSQSALFSFVSHLLILISFFPYRALFANLAH